MSKRENRKFLIKVQAVKIVFYPLLVVLDKVGLMGKASRYAEKITRLIGIEKSLNSMVQFHDFASCFKGGFRNTPFGHRRVLITSFLGVNSNFTLFELLLARYYSGIGLEPVLVVCNSALGICQRENVIRNRRFNPMFCHECWNGYREIEKETGIRIIYLKNIITPDIRERLDNAFRQIDGVNTHDEARAYCFEEIPVGELSYKSVLRYFLKGSLSGTKNELVIFRRFLQSTVVTGILFGEILKSDNAPEKVIIPNGTLALEAVLRNQCHRKGIPYMTFENYMGEDTIIYKKNDEVMKLDWDEEMETRWRHNLTKEEIAAAADRFFSELRIGRHKYAILNREQDRRKVNPYGRFVCAFTNLNFDTAVIGKHTIFSNMEDWLVSLTDFWAATVSELKLVIRVHPAEVKMRSGTGEFMGDILRERVKSDKIIIIDSTEPVNSYDLMEYMEYGLIYSSTIGLEIAHLGKTCVVAGKPYFLNKPFVITPSDQFDYFNTLSMLNRGELRFVPDYDNLNRLVYHIFNVRLKKLKGIKLFSLNTEKMTGLKDPEELIGDNIDFFEEFEEEFSNDPPPGYRPSTV